MASHTYSVTWMREAYKLRQQTVKTPRLQEETFAEFLKLSSKTKRKWVMKAKAVYLQQAHDHE